MNLMHAVGDADAALDFLDQVSAPPSTDSST